MPLYTQNQALMVNYAKTKLSTKCTNFSLEQGKLVLQGKQMNIVVLHTDSRMEIWIKGITPEIPEMLYHKALNDFPRNLNDNPKESMLNHLRYAIKVAKSKYNDLVAINELKQEVLNR